MSLTAIILNGSSSLPDKTIASVNFADEILLIQDSSRAKLSKPIPKNIKVFNRNLDNDFSAQRNFAIGKATSDWLLFVDSDEVVSPSLAKEITSHIQSEKYAGYYLPRLDVFYDRTLKFGETGSIKLLRLARKNAGYFTRSVHEKWIISGQTSTLANPLFHLKQNLVSGFIGRIILYSKLDAEELSKENKNFTNFKLILNPLGKFIQNYFFRLGFLDGTLGFFHAYLMSLQSLSVRIYQWQSKK